MRSRLATVFTAVALVAGTGGAIAIGASGSHGGPLGGAASGQYCNGKKCPSPPKRNCGRHHNQKCPAKPKRCYYYTAHNHRHSYECSAGEKANTGLRGVSSHRSANKGVSSTPRGPSFTG